MKPLFRSVGVWFFLVCLLTSTVLSRKDWTPEFLSQTRRKRCILGKIEHDVTFLHGTDSGDFQKLGKVADMEVCVLLCCEMDKCEAAFMADRNCYAVKCHSQEHCVTAPARKNKWHPLVVFVKKISQSNKADKESQSVHVRNKQNGTAEEDAQKKMSATYKDVLFQVDQSKGKESQTAQAQDTHDEISKEHAQQNTAVKKDYKDSEIPKSSDDKVDSNGIMNSLAIPLHDKPSVIRLDEEETKRKTIPLDKRKTAMRKELFQKSKFSLVSAAVLTCSMAVVLSSVAVIAARIRKKHEADQDPEYSTVPTAEE